MNIRAIKIKDNQRLAALIQSAYQAQQLPNINFAAAHIDARIVQKHLQSNTAYVLEIAEQFVSTISLRFPWGSNPGPFGVPHLGWFATHPDYTRQGFAVKLLVWLERYILQEALKLPAVTLGTAEHHPWLISFYQKQGFRPIAKANLGHGHITRYFEKIIDIDRYQDWSEKRDSVIATGFQLAGKQINIERII